MGTVAPPHGGLLRGFTAMHGQINEFKAWSYLRGAMSRVGVIRVWSGGVELWFRDLNPEHFHCTLSGLR